MTSSHLTSNPILFYPNPLSLPIAPFPSPAGPGVLPFFDGCGPFKRWLPPAEKVSIETMRSGSSTSSLSPEVEALVRSTVLRIRSNGGRVIGLIGFSQGTKVVAGLLRASELRKEMVSKGEMQESEEDWCDFAFGVSVCGSYPPLLMPPSIASKSSEEIYLKQKITTPAFHVQGKQDEWMWAAQGLIEKHYEVGEGMSEVVMWDMGHHYPVQVEESERIAKWMIGVWRGVEAGERERR
jgi:hypothetical protein